MKKRSLVLLLALVLTTSVPVSISVAQEKGVIPPKKVVKQEEVSQSKVDYKRIEVAGGDLSGHREANVEVDIGYGKREYWAYTNEYGQLVRVFAKEVVLQDDKKEAVLSTGRYYKDEAKVPGVESETLDEGHILADSLGGVSNAYNITPQDSTLNRHGDQAYMEENIRKAGGAKDFEALITYANTDTQIPSNYKYTYTLKGKVIVDEFANVNPDKVNKGLQKGVSTVKSGVVKSPEGVKSAKGSIGGDIHKIDTNGNGVVTIKEAKAAGIPMPVCKGDWLYAYMVDKDGDGVVGE